MPTHSTRLRNGVRELIQTADTTLEDLHIIASDVIATLDKMSGKVVRKLKRGQSIRVYDEDSSKEYGQKGSDLPCFFSESHETKTRGTTLKVYDAKQEWSVSVDCLLEVFDTFDPESDEGKKRDNRVKPKRRGRKPKSEATSSEIEEFDTQWSAPKEYEPEEEGEEFFDPEWQGYISNE